MIAKQKEIAFIFSVGFASFEKSLKNNVIIKTTLLLRILCLFFFVH